MTAWAEAELGGAKLGDGRLTQRLIKLATRFADKPTASIPGACGDWAETQAAYRFFEQARESKRTLGWQDILAPHMAQTEARMREHSVVLCLQDTTELNFNGQEIAGLGPLSFEAQRGMYLHPVNGDLKLTQISFDQRFKTDNRWGSLMPGCGHVIPRMLTGTARAFAKACVGQKATNGSPKLRGRCRKRGSSTSPTAKPTSSNACNVPTHWVIPQTG